MVAYSLPKLKLVSKNDLIDMNEENSLLFSFAFDISALDAKASQSSYEWSLSIRTMCFLFILY